MLSGLLGLLLSPVLYPLVVVVDLWCGERLCRPWEYLSLCIEEIRGEEEE